MSEILLYHGSKEEVVYPEIRITRYTKDFSWGFYCTNNYQQAYRWADRRSADGIVNIYRYVENPELKILRFPEMSDEWLDFIAKCRAGEMHPYDIGIPELNSDGMILEHKKTGANIFLMSNEDDNKVFCIGFRTPPADSTGVPHIIEHTVLCGSDKFPVKDPFVELVKGSL